MIPEFQLVPEYSVGSTDPSIHAANPMPVIYHADPARFDQARLQGREMFVPDIDLNRYRCRVQVDWVFLQVRLGRQTQSIHICREIERVLGRRPAVLAPSNEHDAATWNHTGDEFRIKLQDPTLPELRQLAATFEARWGVRGTISVVGIEFAVDFFPAPDVADADIDGDRHRLVAILQRHHLAKARFFNEPAEDPRFFYIGVSGKEHTSFVVPQPGRAEGAPRSICASNVRDKVVNRQVRCCAESESVPMPVDGMFYTGERHGDVMFRVQNKIFDGSDPETRGKSPLRLRKRRARIEVTLLDEGVRRAGIVTLDDLAGFDFATLRKPYFPFWLPTFPVESERPLMKAAYPVTFCDRRDLFLRGGCYLLELCEDARLHNLRDLKLEYRRKEDPSAPRPPRIRIPENGRLVAWEEINRRIGAALRSFRDDWAAGERAAEGA